MLRSFLIAAVFIGPLVLTTRSVGQSPAGSTVSPQDALTFQKILSEFLEKKAGKPRPGDESDTRKREYADLVARLDEYAQRNGATPDVEMVKALCLARRASILLEERRALDNTITAQKLQSHEGAPLTDAQKKIFADREQKSREVAAEYARVEQTLSLALEGAEKSRTDGVPPEEVLIKGVIRAQTALAMLHQTDAALDREEFAKDAKSAGKLTLDTPMVEKLLADAAQLLKSYVDTKEPEKESAGIEYVRGRFYQAVVNYRLSLDLSDAASLEKVKRGTRFSAKPDAQASLANARRFFGELRDENQVRNLLIGTEAARDKWRSSSFQARENDKFSAADGARFYAASACMYLGLIEAIRANDDKLPEAQKQNARQAAESLLQEAKSLDQKPASGYAESEPAELGGESTVPGGVSLTGDLISNTVDRVMSSMATATTGKAEPINDFHIAGGVAALYDTNVTLLGRNTEPPSYKRRKIDFRVPTLLKFDYTLDLNALPGQQDNDSLRKWQVYFEGRVAPTWNARIYDFNEQFYGATADIRYEIARDTQSHGTDANGRPIQGAAFYMDWRYDYDYFMLGNDGFLVQNRVRPSLRYISYNEVVDASLFFAYEARDYLEVLRDERFDRDGNYFSWGLDGTIDLSKIWPMLEAQQLYHDHAWGGAAPNSKDYQDFYRPVRLRLGVQFTTNSTVGDEFDYDSGIASGGITVPLPYGVDLSYDGIFEWQDYWQHSRVDRHRAVREDFIQEHEFRLSRRFYFGNYDATKYLTTNPLDLRRLVLTLYGDIRFTIDDSNVRDRLGESIYEYNRVVYGVGLRFDLN